MTDWIWMKLWLVEAEDSSSGGRISRWEEYLTRPGVRFWSLLKVLLWYGIGVLVGLALAQLH